jgi:hypothetical protein
LAPKPPLEAWLEEALSNEPSKPDDDFIDVSLDEYLADPATHFPRLWDHFR